MKRFLVYLLVIVLTVSAGFGIFYLVRDNEVISISSASIYKDVGQKFTIDIDHRNPKASTTIDISTSDAGIVSYDESKNEFTAEDGGVARINFRTSNTKFRNIWCDVVVGDGSVESPFYISSAEQLASIGMGEWNPDLYDGAGAYMGAEGYESYTSGACYKLVSDIDVSTVNGGYWVPLKTFSGRFDGNGYTISNVNFNSEAYNTQFPENVNLYSEENVGFFQELTKDATVYNVKFNNLGGRGTYTNFGTVTAINRGVIERVEIKNADYILNTEVFGGIAGINDTTETKGEIYARHIARIDRCSISLSLGGEESEVYTNGTIGGIAGINNGGTIVYSYAIGNVYFDASESNVDNIVVTYGGVVGINKCNTSLTGKGGEYISNLQGANLKDCYSAIKTITTPFFNEHVYSATNTTSNIVIAGAIGKFEDKAEEKQDTTDPAKTNTVLQSYIVGIYYNKDYLNYIPEDSQTATTKAFPGVGKFVCDGATARIEDGRTSEGGTIVCGLTSEEMTVSTSFVSHITKELQFTEDGVSMGINPVSVSWLIDSVWAMDPDVNDGMPYLNFQLVYIPDDFASVGTPTIVDGVYNFDVRIEYAINILSAVNGKVRLSVDQEYDLVVSPEGSSVTWSSSDTSVVTVDSKGHIVGVSKGVATVTAMTAWGSSDTVTVIVEEITYSILGCPASLTLTTNYEYKFEGITVYPTTTTIRYAVQDDYYATITDDGVLTTKGYETTTPTNVFIYAGTTRVTIPLTIKNGSGDQGGTTTPDPTAPTFILNAYSINLAKGETFQLKGKANMNGSVTWSTSDSSVATITNNGLITAVSSTSANCKITVTYVSETNVTINAYCVVNVSVPDVNQAIISANPSSLYLSTGKAGTVSITANMSGTFSLGSYAGVSASLSATSGTSTVLTVTGATEGTYTIKVNFTASNGTKASVGVIATVQKDVEKDYNKYIYNATQLNAIRYNLDKEFVLASDIDLSTVSWTPIGTESAPFTGTITNQGSYKISGFTVSGNYAGLFGYTSRANISGIIVDSANISGKYAGGIVGYASATNISSCTVSNSNITGTLYAGGIVGYVGTISTIANCKSMNNQNIKIRYDSSVTSVKSVGGIAGYALSSTISGARVEGGLVSMEANDNLKGYAGGIVGYTNFTVKESLSMTTVTIGTKSSDNYAGGIVGYSSSAITDCTVRSATITGYNAGGIGGALTNSQTVSLSFSNYKKGYRKSDLKSSNYYANVATTAVRESVKVSGNRVGGLFGIINAGVVQNCYTRAELNGTSSSAVKGGFASEIKSNGFKNDGGAGTCGIVENCYSACTFSGSGDNYSVTSSLIHNYFTFGDGSERTAGYIFNYVFDNDLDGKATYYFSSNRFGKDHVEAKKSTSEMKESSTYTDKGFSTTYWNLNGYPTLKTEK